MLSKKEKHEIKKLLYKGKVALNKLNCDFDNKNLQNLLYYYDLCKNDISKLKQAIKILNNISQYVKYSDVENMRLIK